MISTGSGSLLLSFGGAGLNDWSCLILENILVVSTVPELSTWLIELAGFGMVGIAAHRCSSSVVA